MNNIPALDEFAKFANTLADSARALFAPNLGLAPKVEIKNDRTLVTELDQKIELHLRALIEQRYPHHGIYGEESGVSQVDAEWVWVLDPIDGTAPFIAGVPVFGTLIALMYRGTPVLGVMDFPATQDRWLGQANRPTTLNGQICQTRACDSLADAMVTNSNPDFLNAEETEVLNIFRAQSRWRIYGTCCFAYGLLASGRTDLAIDSKLKLYDYAPFIPVIQGAGGVITDWSGNPLTLDNCGPQIVAAGDPRLHATALELIQDHIRNRAK